jgi:hypothetical protein
VRPRALEQEGELTAPRPAFIPLFLGDVALPPHALELPPPVLGTIALLAGLREGLGGRE